MNDKKAIKKNEEYIHSLATILFSKDLVEIDKIVAYQFMYKLLETIRSAYYVEIRLKHDDKGKSTEHVLMAGNKDYKKSDYLK